MKLIGRLLLFTVRLVMLAAALIMAYEAILLIRERRNDRYLVDMDFDD